MSSPMRADEDARRERDRGVVVFTTLAMNQTQFFAKLGQVLAEQGYHVAHVCFHERSHEYLQSLGLKSYNVFTTTGRDPERVELDKYGGSRLNLLLGHEKAAFEISDSNCLVEKYRRYLAAMETIFDDVERTSPSRIWLVQELGGFLSLLAAFYVARARGIDNIFIEPSFFRGRVFFIRNSFAALPVGGPTGAMVSPEVDQYLTHTLRQQQVVIPIKDKHHYRAAGKKLKDPVNVRRFVEKTIDKYIRRKREEFQHIGGHVGRHLRMFVKSLLLRRHYRPIPPGRHFVYYPLHVPADFALTIRSPEFLDQYALIDYLARVVPPTHLIAVKEHPALIGAVEFGRIADLLSRRDNVVLLDPGMNNYEVMNAADAVLTVNSKSGAEALLLGKPVIVLGDTFYRASMLVHRAEKVTDLPSILEKALGNTSSIHDREMRRRYFQNVWDASYPGELYDSREGNVGIFADSLLRMVSEGG